MVYKTWVNLFQNWQIKRVKKWSCSLMKWIKAAITKFKRERHGLPTAAFDPQLASAGEANRSSFRRLLMSATDKPGASVRAMIARVP